MKRQRQKLCAYPGCRAITLSRLCRDHAVAVYANSDKESKRFLNSSAWLNLRTLQLSLVPWCEHCAKVSAVSVPAIDVDHVLPRKTHPQLALEIGNLESLCKRCHARKTRAGA